MGSPFAGLSKMQPKSGGMKERKEPEPKKMGGEHEDESGTKTHTIEEHPDGHFETHMHDGTHESHPDLLHMTTHIGHHMAPEAKHHHSMHDGFSHQSHGVHEDGQHDGTHDHENLDELKGSMDKFLGEEGQEGQGEPEGEEAPAMGGM